VNRIPRWPLADARFAAQCPWSGRPGVQIYTLPPSFLSVRSIMASGKRKRTSSVLVALETLLSANDDVLVLHKTQVDVLFCRLRTLSCPSIGAPPSPSTESGEDESNRSHRATPATSAGSAVLVAQEQAASIPSGPSGLFLSRLLGICKEELSFFVDALNGVRADALADTEDPRIAILQSLVGIPEEDFTGTDECRKLLIDRSFALEYEGWKVAQGALRSSVKQFSSSRPSFKRPALIFYATKRGNRFRDFEKLVGQSGISVLCCFHYSAFTKLSIESRKLCASHLRSPLWQTALRRAKELTPVLQRKQELLHLHLGLSSNLLSQSASLCTRLPFAAGV